MRTINGQTDTSQGSTPKQATCKDRVHAHYTCRINELRALWHAYTHTGEMCQECKGTGKVGKYDCGYCDAGKYPDEGARLCEYGLSFDYVAPGTFRDQRRGYWRYQLSWGGPGDEFRFYADENKQLTRIEYWFLDWLDGAKVRVQPTSRNGRLLGELWELFKDGGTVDSVYNTAMAD